MKKVLLLMLAAILIFCACNGKEDESLAKKAGTKVGETLTDLATGVGKGVDQQMAVDVELSQEMLDMGISKTIAKSLYKKLDSEGKGITVYLKSANAIEAQLVAKAMNKDGLEIGRSTVDVKMGNDDAQYVKFIFDDEMDTQLVTKYNISIKK